MLAGALVVLAATGARAVADERTPAADAVRAVPTGAPLVVAAAASLTEVLPRIAGARGAGAGPISFRFDASSRLARQIDAGAPTDVFLSADAEWMDHLGRAGRLAAGSRADLAGNELVLVVPQGARFAPSTVEELTSPQLERLALGAESVPAGRYARAALEALKVWPQLRARVVSGDSVRTALAWVARGEASAGIVYATDARVEPRVRVTFHFPTSSHPPIVYPGAVIAGAAHEEEARRFLDLCRSPTGRALFLGAGFLPPPTAVPAAPSSPTPMSPAAPAGPTRTAK